MLARSDPVVKVYFSERNTARGGVELEAFSRRERSGSLLPKSRAKPRDLVARWALTDWTDRVQSPLATPSKHDLPLRISMCRQSTLVTSIRRFTQVRHNRQ